MSDTKKGKKGFATLSKEEKKRNLEKSLETRRKNKIIKDERRLLSDEKRTKAKELRAQAEHLDTEADLIDGQCTSAINKQKKESELANEITLTFGTTVSAQYLKQMIQHAIMRNMSIDQIVTPTMAAMDVLNDPEASNSERKEASKMLQSFESAKPAIVEEKGESLMSVQGQLEKLMNKFEEVGPKR